MTTFRDSECSDGRWAELFTPDLGDWTVVGEEANLDYQGSAEALLEKDGQFAYVQWTWGSCGGCDEWEGLSGAQLAAEAAKQVMKFSGWEALVRWRDALAREPRTNAKKLEWIKKALVALDAVAPIGEFS
jgi:hypothetical protein